MSSIWTQAQRDLKGAVQLLGDRKQITYTQPSSRVYETDSPGEGFQERGEVEHTAFAVKTSFTVEDAPSSHQFTSLIKLVVEASSVNVAPEPEWLAVWDGLEYRILAPVKTVQPGEEVLTYVVYLGR